jgi:transposase
MDEPLIRQTHPQKQGERSQTRHVAHLLKVSVDYVRDVIHAFNERGFEALDPKMERGRTAQDR